MRGPVMMLFGVLACSVPARTASPTATGSSSKSIMILKNPRSGSSYFMGLLNAFPTIHVTDDILTPHSFRFGNVSADWLEYLSSALREPITRYDTIRARTFNETAIINRRRKQLYGDDEMDKRWHALDLVGFSICPSIHAFELDLRELAAVAPQTYLVVYIRTNKIKQAVAQLRGEKMKAECPNAVSRGGRLSSGDVAGKKEPCRVSETLHVDTEDLALALGTARLAGGVISGTGAVVFGWTSAITKGVSMPVTFSTVVGRAMRSMIHFCASS